MTEQADARADYAPDGHRRARRALRDLKRTVKEFSEDNMTDWAAALTYYGLLSLFPALIALVSIIGLVADPRQDDADDHRHRLAARPEVGADTFAGPIKSITSNRGAAGILFVVGLGAALWSASGYVGAFMRASNIIYETPEGRPIWKLRPLQILVTLVMIVLLAAVLLGARPDRAGRQRRRRPARRSARRAADVWNIAKWPVMLLVVILMFAVLYHAAPNVKLPGFKWVTPGRDLSRSSSGSSRRSLFAFYVANFGSYDKTYGTLGGIVALLVWMWITNVALLLGMELNAERERARELDEGVPRAEQRDPARAARRAEGAGRRRSRTLHARGGAREHGGRCPPSTTSRRSPRAAARSGSSPRRARLDDRRDGLPARAGGRRGAARGDRPARPRLRAAAPRGCARRSPASRGGGWAGASTPSRSRSCPT